VDEVFELSAPIKGKIWLIGEHCAPEFTGCAHGAFRSGIEAAKQTSTLILGNTFEVSPFEK
jgi:monoamine oxidase